MAHRIGALTGGFVLLAMLTIHGPGVTQRVFAATNDTFPGTAITTPQYSGIVATGSNVGATTEVG